MSLGQNTGTYRTNLPCSSSSPIVSRSKVFVRIVESDLGGLEKNSYVEGKEEGAKKSVRAPFFLVPWGLNGIRIF